MKIVAGTEIKEWEAYYFEPFNGIADAPFVPRGMHRVAAVEDSEGGTLMFRVVGSKRWHSLNMFVITDMNATW